MSKATQVERVSQKKNKRLRCLGNVLLDTFVQGNVPQFKYPGTASFKCKKNIIEIFLNRSKLLFKKISCNEMKHFSLSQSNMLQSVSSTYWAIHQMACSVCVRHMWVSEGKQRTFLFLLFLGPFLRFCPSGSTHPPSSFPPYSLPSQGGGKGKGAYAAHTLLFRERERETGCLNKRWKSLKAVKSIKYFRLK